MLLPGRCFLLAVLLASFSQVHAADAKLPEAMLQSCAACHGQQGVSAMPLTPSLAGQPDGFLQWQLVFFRSRTRVNEVMSPISATLTDADVRALGAYFAAMPAASLPVEMDPDPLLTERGSKLAQQNRCASCHGERFEGDKVAARLAGQHEEYLNKSLIDYKEGRRRGVGIAAMPNAVGPLSSEDIKALSHYLARLR